MHELEELDLATLINNMQDPRREALLGIYYEYQELFHYAKGSGHNHQAWKGGYADHIADCIRINYLTYEPLNNFRKLPFTADQATICLFFHDIEKLFKYAPEDHEESNKMRQFLNAQSVDQWEQAKWVILEEFKYRYQFELSLDEVNAIRYTHGEGSDHRKDERIACPLAAHVHHCDNTSARIYFDDGEGLG